MRYLLAFILTFYFGLAQASTVLLSSGGMTSGSAACFDDGDTLDEGFEGSGYENSWTTTGVGDGDPDAARPGSDVSDLCEDSMLWDTSANEEEYIYYDNGSDDSTVYIRFYMYVTDSGCDTNETRIIGLMDTVSLSDHACYIKVYWSGGCTYSVRGVGASISDSCGGMNQDTWYRVEMKCVDNGASEIRLDGAAAKTFTASNAGGIRYYYIGPYNNGRTGTELYIDQFTVDTTGYPGP